MNCVIMFSCASSIPTNNILMHLRITTFCAFDFGHDSVIASTGWPCVGGGCAACACAHVQYVYTHAHVHVPLKLPECGRPDRPGKRPRSASTGPKPWPQWPGLDATSVSTKGMPQCLLLMKE